MNTIKSLWRQITTREVHVMVCDGKPCMWRDELASLTWHRALYMLNTGVICEFTKGRVKRSTKR